MDADPSAPNLAGALIFFSYIISALVFTGLIVHDLLQLHRHPTDANKQQDDSQTEAAAHAGAAQVANPSFRLSLSILLTLLSFATLSYHMLYFLIDSYVSYCSAHSLPWPQTPFEVLSASPPLYIWTWATHSTLFQDFAYSLFSKPGCCWWASKALLYTFVWNRDMAENGVRYSIPRLWAFFVLDQILPVSFTQNLFLIAMQLVPPRVSTRTLRPTHPSINSFIFLAYLACLYAAPKALDTPYFFLVLFTTRALLLAPYFVFQTCRWSPSSATKAASPIKLEARNGKSQQHASTVFVIGSVVLDMTYGHSLTSISLAAINDNYGVKALGYDFLIGIASLVVQYAPIPGAYQRVKL